ncbi:hypothetical protein C9426_15940 [Serratia sp. S1B]|nr:hypothetical protein C9426_15940 [Serratia sp. S1B]
MSSLDTPLSLIRYKKSYLRALPLASLIAAALITPLNSQACGPFFLNRLLVDRNSTLLLMPEGNFAFETRRLVPVDKQLPLWKEPAPEAENAPKPASLSPEQQIIARMRATHTVEQADAVNNQGLSNAAHLYTLGAVAFAAQDPRAAEYFQQVLALPVAEQGEWGLRAQYSLGRVFMGDYAVAENQSSSTAPSSPHPKSAQLAQATAAFQQVIDKVKAGAADPDQLALSSLGQQARIHLWLGEIAPAVQLYAQQAAQGDPQGGLSLQYISSYLAKPEHLEALKQAINDPLVQQLVTIELFTRSSNLSMMSSDDGASALKQTITPILTLLNDSVKNGFAGSDRLAALAYRSGQYAMATSLLKQAGDGGLAWWLRAKMALRAGDIKAATAAYAKAAAAFPTDETWGQPRGDIDDFNEEPIVPDCRVSGEQAILALNRGDYLQAIELMYRGKEPYWADVADIAERVLTVDELKGFVDKHVPPPSIPLKPVDPDDYDYTGQRLPIDVKLRELLARRLMRAGRYQEALSYFAMPNYHQAAEEFAAQLQIAQDKAQDKITRAKAYYQAATLLRTKGLKFTGYEMTPDYAIYGADYSYVGDAFNTHELKHKSWISAAEAARADKSLPDADNRFLHYRWQAVELAKKSANLLPPKSQAYAAVLCHATRWIMGRDAKAGRALYQRYIKNGAIFDWSNQFGIHCPAPEFVKTDH